MTTKEFIEKAIEGGWLMEGLEESWFWGIDENGIIWRTDRYRRNECNPDRMFLDPLAWQAVGKVEGWDIGWQCDDCGKTHQCDGENCSAGGTHPYGYYRKEMHRLIDALAEGKTIEEFLTTL